MKLFESHNHQRVFVLYLIKTLAGIGGLLLYMLYTNLTMKLVDLLITRVTIAYPLLIIFLWVLPFLLFILWHVARSRGEELDKQEQILQARLAQDEQDERRRTGWSTYNKGQ